MSAAESTNMKYISDSDYYIATLDAFDRTCNRRSVMYDYVENELPAVGTVIAGTSALIVGVLRVLSTGAGDGGIDSKILMKLRQREQLRIHAVILEPDPLMMGRYKAAIKESDKLQGIDFEWRQETLEKFQESQSKEDKFHFITCISSCHYLEDKEKSIRYLYDQLDAGGVLIITLMSEDGGFGKLWQYHCKFEQGCGRDRACIDVGAIKKICKNQGIPVSETVVLKFLQDITPCFASSLHELSEEGNMLLDFLTHTIGFIKNSPPEYRDTFLQLLGSEDCSTREASGQILLNCDNIAFIIRAQDHS